MTVFVEPYCWWEDFTVCCGERTKKQKHKKKGMKKRDRKHNPTRKYKL